ncbi:MULTISPECIES: hypothetical protein [unclassified Kaistella]|nr:MULTISPECIES: hypothetical protein [unclassified Kaistella]MDP2452496.1 hypothetical protein [Kaistella sp. SH11-4b]MDP2455404.1 hypothetical protein [Kaistella sp. SH40-3]MDP2458308.1 hypothetical protein [Kaistella sp. SH19-2b]
MKTLKIYNIIAVLIIILLCAWVVQLQNDIKETEKALQQCSDRYYQEIAK